MKKLLISVVALLVLLLGALAVMLLRPAEETPPPEGQPSQSNGAQSNAQSGQPDIDVRKTAQTEADILESLDYEISQNQDTVGWLKVDGTKINNSVVQSHNNATYLRTTERGQYDLYGCYFADYNCNLGAREDLSTNTVIYGHSDLQDNPEGPRFSQLFHFTDPQFAKNTPVVEFATLEEGLMYWQVFAVFYPEINTLDYIRADMTGEELAALAEKAMSQSIYNYGVTVGEEDKILTLSTCTIKFGKDNNNYRFVIMAKLLPEGEEPPDTADIQVK